MIKSQNVEIQIQRTVEMAERETGASLSLVEICTVPVSDSDRPNERPTEEGGTDRRGGRRRARAPLSRGRRCRRGIAFRRERRLHSCRP